MTIPEFDPSSICTVLLPSLPALLHWDACVHEAGHAVECTRCKVRIVKVTIGDDSAGHWGGTHIGAGQNLPHTVLVAGCVAQDMWSVKPCKFRSLFSSRRSSVSDFCVIKSEVAASHALNYASDADAEYTKRTQVIWNSAKRKLRRVIQRDKTYRQRVLAVARALSLAPNGVLTGDEITRILEDVQAV